MYARHFGLQHEPFSIAPDPRYLFMSERHREALAHLLYGLQSGGGFVLLTGEIGAGKTTVCRCFLEQVPKHCHVAYLFNPKLTAPELLQSVCEEFGVAPAQPGIKGQVDALNAFLLRTHADGEVCVLVIDEAQGLASDVLEQLRLLTNLETDQRKLLQIILIGQPELRDMLERPELEQLAQRIIARFHLGPLSPADTAHYIRHRLAVAGHHGAPPFDRAARQRIHALAGGIPRRINLLCDRALLGAYASGRTRAGRGIVDQAAREVFDDARAARHDRQRRWALAAVVTLTGAAALAWWNQRPGLDVPRTAPQAKAAASAPAAAASMLLAAAASAATAASTPASAPPPPARPTPVAQIEWPDDPWPDGQAWRVLAQHWNTTLDEDAEPCSSARAQQLQCYRNPQLTLASIRQLGRPGVVSLQRDGAPPVSALLLALGDDHVTLRLGERRQTLTLAAFGQAWKGDYGTFWRTPGTEISPAWIAQRLGRLAVPPGGPEASLQARIAAFQRSQGLVADGVAGSMTLMQLNRALGVDEPRLAGDGG